jgi:eukaryotic-like serine/threonine-protein kinase
MPAPDDQADIGVRPGDVIAGKYRVERVLGVGGMGVVVAAHHVQLDERVALKFLLPVALGSAEASARFIREARATVKIKNEHVARVSDVGQLENGAPYIVMEYLEGEDLSSSLAKNGAMPVEQAADFVLQACEAIAEAHALGIVHRDLKPANLFCVRRSDGELFVKVLDFGISKIKTPGVADLEMTRTTSLLGSPLYMSPEQMWSSKGVDTRTDIWSLGIILFELVAGRPPFVAEAVTELAVKVTNEPAPSLRALRPDVDPGLEQVIAKCLEKDRAQRFQTLGELAVALRDFAPQHSRRSVDRVLGILRGAALSGVPAPSSEVLASTGPEPPKAATTLRRTATSWERAAAGARSAGKRLKVIAAAALVGVLVTGGALVLRKAAPSSPAPSAAVAIGPTLPSAPSVVQAQPLRIAEPPTAQTVVGAPAATAALPAAPSPPIIPAPASQRARSMTGGNGKGPIPTVSAPSPSATTAHTPNCTPPYVIDSVGDRQYKPECL